MVVQLSLVDHDEEFVDENMIDDEEENDYDDTNTSDNTHGEPSEDQELSK